MELRQCADAIAHLRSTGCTGNLSSPVSSAEQGSYAQGPAPVRVHPNWRGTKEPQVFDGTASDFKEWVFAVELALRAQAFDNKEREVNYASSFLSGNARLWLIASQESGETFEDWPALKSALAKVYGPQFDGEQARLGMFSAKQCASISAYTTEFLRLSLQVPEIDERSRALLFINGLQLEVRKEVMKEHPATLSQAIQAAQTVNQVKLLEACVSPRELRRRSSSEMDKQWPQKLTPEERQRLRREQGCFACRKPGHFAKDCPVAHPNAGRQ